MLNDRMSGCLTFLLWSFLFFQITVMRVDCSSAENRESRLIISPAGSQIKAIDSGMIFNCSYAPGPGDESALLGLSWYQPGHRRVQANSGRVYVERTEDGEGLRLFIRNVEERDEGLYTCAAELTRHRRLTEETRIFLFEDINFVDTPIYQAALLGSNPLLRCEARGQPNPKITWRFSRRKILTDDDKYSLEPEGLRIKDLDLRDNGTYECRAEVESHGNVKLRLVTIDVLYPPVILRAPNADMVIRGHNKALECRAVGNPSVKYEWFREQKMTEMIRVKVKLAEDVEELDLGEVTSEDEGRYFCRVSNEHGTREVHVDVKMLVPPEMNPLPERILLNEGADLNLSCEATGVPFPKISWSKHSKPGRGNYTRESMRISGSWIENSHPGINTLMLRKVQKGFSGIFSCSAENPVGYQDRTVEVFVQFAPVVKITAPEQVGWSGQTREFKCMAGGLPPPTIVWYRGEQYITNDRMYSISIERGNDSVISVLTIRIEENKPWMYSSYSCMAKNPLGHTTERARLEEAFAPDTPRDLMTLDVTSTSATLQATLPSRTGGMPIISWLLKYEEVSNKGQSKTLDFPVNAPLAVRNLVPDTRYNFYLSVSNAVGTSHPAKLRVTTPRLQVIKEQLDYPGLMEDHLYSDGRKDPGYNTNMNPAVYERGVKMDDSILSTQNITVLGIAAGTILVLLAIIITTVCAITWKIKQKRRSVDLHHKRTGHTTESSTIPLAIRRPNDPLPDVASHTDETNEVMYYGSMGRHDSLMTSPQGRQDSLITSPQSTLQRVRVTSFSPVSMHKEMTYTSPRIQPRELTYTSPLTQHREITYTSPLTQHRDITFTPIREPAAERPSHFSPIPQHKSATFTTLNLQRREPTNTTLPVKTELPSTYLMSSAGTVPRVVYAKTTRVGNPSQSPMFMDDILDGYISGENVDDDIDKVDFTIRLPSIHGKMCDL